jgi:3-hydroxybutyryl-CoA dehydrogenase
MAKPIQSVLIAGFGVMGKGVATSFHDAGFDVTILTRDPARVLASAPEGMQAVSELPDEAPDFVSENFPEDIPPKHALYAKMEAKWGGATVISTNTSGLDLEELAKPLHHKENFLGVHYLQPAEAFACVEEIRISATSDDTAARVNAALERTGKEVVMLNRPIVGALFNRLQHAMLHEAYWMVQEGFCSVEDVDKFARLAFGPRMCAGGLIEVKDLGGLVVHAKSQSEIIPNLHLGRTAIQWVQDLPVSGRTGADAGEGFYKWAGKDVAQRRREVKETTRKILDIIEPQVRGGGRDNG